MQEFEAAKDAILSRFPNAVVNSKRQPGNDLLVFITKDGEVVWSGDQRRLFSKNGQPAVPEIQAKLDEL